MNSSTEHSSAPVRRRSLMKTAAWAAPTAAVSLSAPAFAASPQSDKGLQGWVGVRKSCGFWMTISIDGVGRYPNRGLWIMESTEGFDLEEAEVERAKITFYFPAHLDVLGWNNNSTGGWSALTRDTAEEARNPGDPLYGYYAYSSTYSGTWRYNRGNNLLIADGQPRFAASTDGCPTFTAYARRTVTVDNETISFVRGPISL